jgi:hypothetical protein
MIAIRERWSESYKERFAVPCHPPWRSGLVTWPGSFKAAATDCRSTLPPSRWNAAAPRLCRAKSFREHLALIFDAEIARLQASAAD